jgi:alanyl-tRNA synthetase
VCFLLMKAAGTSSAVCCAVQFVTARHWVLDRPFLHELTETVGEIMGVYYPSVVDNREYIAKIIRTEEERFHETLSDGLAILGEISSKAKG